MNEFTVKVEVYKCEDCKCKTIKKGSVLTNFSADRLSLYNQAVFIYEKMFDDKSLFIDGDAKDVCGKKLENHFALKTRCRKDYSVFWKLYEALHESKKYNV